MSFGIRKSLDDIGNMLEKYQLHLVGYPLSYLLIYFKGGKNYSIVLDCSHVSSLDYTAIQVTSSNKIEHKLLHCIISLIMNILYRVLGI